MAKRKSISKAALAEKIQSVIQQHCISECDMYIGNAANAVMELLETESLLKKIKEPIPIDLKNAMVEAYIEIHFNKLKIKPSGYNYAGLNECYKKIVATSKELNPDFVFDFVTMKATFRAILNLAYTQFYGKDLQLTTINKYIIPLIAELRNGKQISNKQTAAELNYESTQKAAAMLIGAIR